MVTRFGMDPKVGQRTYRQASQPFLPGAPTGPIEAAEVTAREIDVAVRDWQGNLPPQTEHEGEIGSKAAEQYPRPRHFKKFFACSGAFEVNSPKVDPQFYRCPATMGNDCMRAGASAISP